MIRLFWRGLGLCAVAALIGVPARAGSFEIRWLSHQTNRIVVEVQGLSAEALRGLRQSRPLDQWQRLFAVFAEQGDLTADVFLPAMLGRYEATASALRFESQFPPQPGQRYRAVFRPAELPLDKPKAAAPVVLVFEVPRPKAAAFTHVEQIYPTGDLLPENLLKFYVYFSAPMSRGGIYDHIHLQTAAGTDVELPFLQIDEELWDAEMKRLTLFIDPGRIKRGVLPLDEVGPALEAGREYTLRIDRAWRDAAGNPLREDFRKRFKVGPPDREPPDASKWELSPPSPNTREPLTVRFREPMDHALAARLINVVGPSGKPLEGVSAIADQERRWQFTPAAAWKPGRHALQVRTIIEDLAGNNIGKAFEVDLFDGVQQRLTNSTVSVSFQIQ